MLPVSVVIPARNEEQTIVACVRALREQSVSATALEVIVVVAGDDRTAAVAASADAGEFGRFEIVRLEEGDKNAALRAGCARATGETLLLLDADTELAPTAIEEFVRVLASAPRTVAHGAMHPRINTWVARYSELNRKLVKQLSFDGHLSGEVIALPRAAVADDLATFFPDNVGPNCDAYLGRILRQHGWRTAYASAATATTLFPWTVRGLIASQLRNRRSAIATLSWMEAVPQAAKSAVLVVALPIAIALWSYSAKWAVVCASPLFVHVASFAWRVESLRRRGYGDYRLDIPLFATLDVIARGLKLWAFLERVVGRRPLNIFRGERPETPLPFRTAAGNQPER